MTYQYPPDVLAKVNVPRLRLGIAALAVLDPGDFPALQAASWNDEGVNWTPEEDFMAIAGGFQRLADAAEEYQKGKN